MSLFPSAQAVRSEAQDSPNSQKGGTSLNWLNNASYKGDARIPADRKPFKDVLKVERTDSTEDVRICGERKKSGSSHSVSREHRKKHKEKDPLRHKERKERECGHHKSSKRRDRSRSRSRSKEKCVSSRPSSFWLDDQTNPAETIFFIDSKSDRNNLSFDSAHYKDAAFYRTLGRTCLGGTDLNPDIFRGAGSKTKSKAKYSVQGRYFNQRVAAKSTNETVDMSKGEQREKIAGFSEEQEIQERSADPFILIESTSTSTPSKVSELDPLNLYDKGTQQYLGIIPKNDGERAADSPKAEGALKDPMTDRIAHFNNHLNDSPDDINKWIEFINFQDELVDSALFNQLVGKRGQLRNREELLVQRKLSILEKALQKNPGCLRLQLEQVEVCRNHWDSGRVSDLWEQMVKAHPGEVGLWRPYLLYCQSSYSSFSISKVATLYADCIQDLLKSSGECDEERRQENEDNLFEIFLLLCHFWHQSGHTEKAVAAFQAMIELNIFCPANLGESSPLPAQLAFLETFWDCDEPKFGETGAKGWSQWMHLKEKGGWQNTASSQSTDSDEEEDSLDPTLSKVRAWLVEETRRGSHDFLPWRPDPSKGQSVDDCEDPDRLVLFDDIGKTLFGVTSDHRKWQLILSFLEFLGISTESMLTTNSQHTHSSLSSTLQSVRDITSSKFAVSSWEEDLSWVNLSSLWHSAWHKSCPGVLHGCDGMGLAKDGTECELDKSQIDKQFAALSRFVDNGVDQLIAVVPQERRAVLRKLQLRFHLTKSTLSTEAKTRKKQVKTIQKIAKKTLSLRGNRNDLALWETYALWEWGIGNLKESQRIFETALTFAGAPKNEEEVESYTRSIHTISTLKLHLVFSTCRCRPRYQSEAESVEVVDSDDVKGEVLNYLATLGEGVKFVALPQYHDGMVTSGRILKARKRFVELLEETQMEYSPIVGPSPAPESDTPVVPSGSYLYHLCICYAIFQYLTVSLQAANVVYQDMLAFIDKVPLEEGAGSSLSSPQSEIDQEMITVAQVQLLSYHSAVNPVPLAALRGVLQRALSSYPSNPALLEVFLQTEGRSQVVGRLRRYFHRAVEVTESPVPMFYAIISQLRRQTRIRSEMDIVNDVTSTETGISHHIRSLFEKAVRMRHTRHCILLWRMFIQYEVSQSNMKNAKAVFYRALQHCPWSKVLYMDMIRYFPSEAEEFIDLMMEKEVRVRVPLEEIELLMSAGS